MTQEVLAAALKATTTTPMPTSLECARRRFEERPRAAPTRRPQHRRLRARRAEAASTRKRKTQRTKKKKKQPAATGLPHSSVPMSTTEGRLAVAAAEAAAAQRARQSQSAFAVRVGAQSARGKIRARNWRLRRRREAKSTVLLMAMKGRTPLVILVIQKRMTMMMKKLAMQPMAEARLWPNTHRNTRMMTTTMVPQLPLLPPPP